MRDSINWLIFRRPITACKPAYTSSFIVMVSFFCISTSLFTCIIRIARYRLVCKGLKIILRGTPQLEQFPEAKAAFQRAGRALQFTAAGAVADRFGPDDGNDSSRCGDARARTASICC